LAADAPQPSSTWVASTTLAVTPLAALAGAEAAWMMSTADQGQPNVATAPWKANTPKDPPLGEVRALFRFDGSAGMEAVGGF